jgi:hypothetical protein
MNKPDLVLIIGNISQNLYPVRRLISGGAYILGIVFFMTAISKLHALAAKRSHGSSQEKMYAPVIYLLMGVFLIYLPSLFPIMANTLFGAGNVLTYTKPTVVNVYTSMGVIIRTAGLLWFVRGCVLVVHSSQPGTKHGSKGLAFMVAGVLAMNFDNTISMINKLMSYITQMTLAVKLSQGY